MKDPIPLLYAHELAPLSGLISQDDAALIERFCETNRVWTEQGRHQASMLTSGVRDLLQVAVTLARECVRLTALLPAEVTINPMRCSQCGTILHVEMGRLRCRVCDLQTRAMMTTLPDTEEGGP